MSRPDRARRLGALFLLMCVLVASCADQPAPTASPSPAPATVGSANPPGPSPTAPGSTPSARPAATGTAPGTAPTAPTGPAQQTPVRPAATATPVQPSSFDKLRAAEESGELDRDTVLVYSLFAAYDPARLPDEYRGEDEGQEVEATTILAEIAERGELMTAALREQVRPFLLRPTDPNSFWKPRKPLPGQGGGKTGGLSRYSGQGITYGYVDAARTRMRVWYVEALGDQEVAIATRLAAEIDGSDMWQLQKRAMLGHEPCSDAAVGAPRNGGDDRLDLYLVYPGTGLDWNGRQQDINHARGVAVPEARVNQCGWSTFLLVNSVRSFEGMKSTTAHELFHAFQFSFKLSSEYQWWMEASATWAQDLVYPELNVEQERLVEGGWALLGAPVGPLDRFQSGKHYQYGAYIWPFYLTHRPGGKPELVGEIWRSGEQKRPIQAMRELSDWQESFKQFALWLYNEQPVEKLLDAGKRIEPLQQIAGCWRPDCKLPPGTHELQITLNRLSLAYYLVERSGEEKDVKQLRFKLDDVSGQQAVGLQAIITLGDKEHPPVSVGVVDWSDTAERTFCLEREDLREVVLVVSNSSIATPGQLSGKLVLEALEEPCPAEAGFVYETSASYELNRDDGDLKVSASASSRQLVSGDWEIGFQERTADETRYVITSTNRIELEANASLQGTRGDTAGSTHIRIAGSGVSHNPVRPGDDQYGSLARPLYPAESTPRPPYSPGQLVLYERDGRHLYRVTIGLASIRAGYTYQSHLEYDCGESRNTYDESYDNGTLVAEIKERGNPDCFSAGDKTWTEKEPNVFGAFVAYADRPNRVPGTSGPISGEYDPRTGVIEGENTFETASCEQAEPYDPIPIARLMREHASIFDLDMREHGSCTLRFTMRWRFVLPGSGR